MELAMKKLYCLFALLFVVSASAQNPTSYFMEGSSMRGQWNPAFAPNRGYFNIPVIGGIQFGAQGNIALDNLLFVRDGELTTFMSSKVAPEQVLSSLQDMNRFGAAMNMNLLGFGAYTKNQKNFWSVDVNMRVNADARAPYEFFEFMKTGVAGNFANLGLSADAYLEAGFSYSFPVMEKLYVGVRGKVLVGAVRAAFNFDEFDAYMSKDRWYAHTVGMLEMSGFSPQTEVSDDGEMIYDLEDFDGGLKTPAGYGFGIDIGATYDVLPNLQVSLSVCDLGFISWTKSATSVGKMAETVEFDGFEMDMDGNITGPSLDLDDLDFAAAESKGITKALRASINAGGEYNFLDRKIGLGLFYQVKFWDFKTQHNITAAANFRPLKWLHLSGSYSFLNNRAHSLGLALNLCPGFINLFVATDVLFSKKTPQWVPISQSNMNITFGLGVPIGKRGLRNEVADKE